MASKRAGYARCEPTPQPDVLLAPSATMFSAAATGPDPVEDPWGAFADDQLGLMDHLGIRQFLFFGNCIGGWFALKLMERAPERIVAAVLSQPMGHRPENPGVMFVSPVWSITI
jgi:pimeloyl-ACP methyl ester carboxylesterase